MWPWLFVRGSTRALLLLPRSYRQTHRERQMPDRMSSYAVQPTRTLTCTCSRSRTRYRVGPHPRTRTRTSSSYFLRTVVDCLHRIARPSLAWHFDQDQDLIRVQSIGRHIQVGVAVRVSSVGVVCSVASGGPLVTGSPSRWSWTIVTTPPWKRRYSCSQNW